MAGRVIFVLNFFVGLMLSSAAFAWQLKGKVTDEKGVAIPYASVYVRQSTYGVATNLKGEYFLELSNGTHQITFRAVGYESQTMPVIINNAHQVLNVKLNATATELGAVTISADREDPAYPIMRKAIANRKKYQRPDTTFSVAAFVKASLQYEYFIHDTMDQAAKDTIPDRLAKQRMNYYESVGSLYFGANGERKEVKTGVHDLADKDKSTRSISIRAGRHGNDGEEHERMNRELFGTDLTAETFDFYQNNLNLSSLGPVPFVSPLSPLAFASYRFKLEENFQEDGYWVNKIKVIPKRSHAALFSGYIYIIDDWWCIKALDLKLDPTELYFFANFKILQDYKRVGDSLWMPVREEFFYNSKKRRKLAIGNTLVTYSSYDFSFQPEKNFFQNELRLIVDDAYDKDSVFWMTKRPVTLKTEELSFIREQDSIRQYKTSPAYFEQADSSYNHHDIWDFLLSGVGWQNSFKKQKIRFNPLVEQMYIFGVGGYRHAPGINYKKEFSKAYQLKLKGKLNYGFKNKDVKGSAGWDIMYLPKRFGRFHGEYRNTYELLNEYESLQAILARGNYVNDEFFSVGHELEVVNGLMADVTVEYGLKKPITGIELESWSSELFGDFNEPTPFDPYGAAVVDLTLKYTIKQQYYSEPYKKVLLPAKYPVISLSYRKGIPGVFLSSVNYDYLEVKIEDDIQLGTSGQSKIRVRGGSFVNDKNILIADQKFFRRSDPWLFSNPLNSFQLLRPGPRHVATTKPYGQLNYHHSFNGTLLNKIPLIKRIGLQAAVGAGTLYIQDKDLLSNAENIQERKSNFRHAEVYAGIEWPFRIGKQRFKLTSYYVVGDSNVSKIAGEIKFGIDFFNSWENSWSY